MQHIVLPRALPPHATDEAAQADPAGSGLRAVEGRFLVEDAEQHSEPILRELVAPGDDRPEVLHAEVLRLPRVARPPVHHAPRESAAVVQSEWKDRRGVGEAGEGDGADVVHQAGLEKVDMVVCVALDLAEAGGVELLEDVQTLLKEVFDVVLVCEADDSEELGERDGALAMKESDITNYQSNQLRDGDKNYLRSTR